MNRFHHLPSITSLLLIAAILLPPLVSHATTAPKNTPAAQQNNPQTVIGPIATQVAAFTGIAISPLLGTGAYGAWQWWQADTAERASLPWFAQVWFWLPALLVVGAIAAKDAAGAALPPGLKKPADVLETVENKISGLVAAGAVIPSVVGTLSNLLSTQTQTAAAAAETGVAGAGGAAGLMSSGLAMMPGLASLTGDIGSWLLWAALLPVGLAAFVVVWMASHAINVLILLSPWGVIDAALKSLRTALLGGLVAVSAFDPWVGLILSLLVILVAALVAGWAFRLTVFGTIFTWEFFTLRRLRFEPDARENKMFSSALLKRKGVPVRTYGRLLNEPENGRLVFAFKPWLLLSERRVEVRMDAPSVGRGLLFSTIRDETGGTALILPPRYSGHEERVAEVYALEGGVREAGIRKAWSSLRELFGGSAARTQM
ncbi:hypothetical protein Ga0100231_007550 [Opitutaceae bacterium TAV4]|nr:hypothetical protein Ga0100231_007550 [Opitutaceae bacterium TAV4]RRJ98330.1 hypothetical protein Ga0100230_007825 [Opitutaceae bacterium TAV3]